MKRLTATSAGFTFVELLVVIGILGLVLAMVVTAKPNTAATRVTAAAYAIAATLQLARAQAMASNIETIFRVDTQKHVVGFDKSMHALPRGMTVAITVAETERMGNRGGLRFYPDGQSSGGEIILTLDGRTTRIAVNWLTGEPQLVK